jgi:hypothetical protein
MALACFGPSYLRCVAVEWANRRVDVIEGLRHLAAEPVVDADGNDPRWPDLRNAIHWVVDDTFWDQHHPREDIGLLVEDEEEAQLAHELVAALDRMEEMRPGPRSDQAWFEDPAWPDVRRCAEALLSTMERSESEGDQSDGGLGR